MGSPSYVLVLIHFLILTSVFLEPTVASDVSVPRIIADSDGNDVMNTDEVDSNDTKCSTPDAMCAKIYAPVKCENDCTYNNLCLAESAQQLNCCEMIYAPVTCEDDSTYDNLCHAESAQQLNCCQIPDENTACIERYAPVKCENDCTYDNLCLAESAQQSNCCPVPDEGAACIEIYAPVKCENGCAYENDCFAVAAGFDITTCLHTEFEDKFGLAPTDNSAASAFTVGSTVAGLMSVAVGAALMV